MREDLAHVNTALEAVQQTVTAPEDSQLAERIVQDYERYRNNLELHRLLPSSAPISEIARWSDTHHMGDLLVPCRELANRQRDRMKDSLERSESQTTWAGRVLFCLGFAGVMAGLLSGYATARGRIRVQRPSGLP